MSLQLAQFISTRSSPPIGPTNAVSILVAILREHSCLEMAPRPVLVPLLLLLLLSLQNLLSPILCLQAPTRSLFLTCQLMWARVKSRLVYSIPNWSWDWYVIILRNCSLQPLALQRKSTSVMMHLVAPRVSLQLPFRRRVMPIKRTHNITIDWSMEVSVPSHLPLLDHSFSTPSTFPLSSTYPT